MKIAHILIFIFALWIAVMLAVLLELSDLKKSIDNNTIIIEKNNIALEKGNEMSGKVMEKIK